MSRRSLWQLTIGSAGIGYLILALWANIQSAPFAVVFVLAAGYEVIDSHIGKHKS